MCSWPFRVNDFWKSTHEADEREEKPWIQRIQYLPQEQKSTS